MRGLVRGLGVALGRHDPVRGLGARFKGTGYVLGSTRTSVGIAPGFRQSLGANGFQISEWNCLPEIFSPRAFSA